MQNDDRSELLDLVNTHDVVIGTTTKDKSHRDSGIHRCVAVFVFDASGKLLIQKRKDDNTWDHSVGGHVQKGEEYDKAAMRESYEELLISYPLHHVSVFVSDERIRGGKTIHMFGLYTCNLPAKWQFIPTDEVNEIEFRDVEEILKDMKKNAQHYARGFINTMNEYVKKHHSKFSEG